GGWLNLAGSPNRSELACASGCGCELKPTRHWELSRKLRNKLPERWLVGIGQQHETGVVIPALVDDREFVTFDQKLNLGIKTMRKSIEIRADIADLRDEVQ